MIQLQFETKDAKAWLAQFQSDKVAGLMRKELVLGLTEVGVDLTASMTKRAPVGATQRIRRSHRRHIDQKTLTLTVFNAAPYAVYQHEGTHHTKQPPTDELVPWVIRKLRVPRKEAKGVAFLIARAIKRKGGLKARKWMEALFLLKQGQIKLRMQQAIASFVKQARAGRAG